MSGDPTMESIRSRLLKVLRLAQDGVGGERENASVLLEKLLRKHSMTMADLDGALDEPRTTVWLDATDVEERTVLSQVAVRLFGTSRKLWKHTQAASLGIDVTASEHAALLIAWEVYRAAFADARHALLLGFCLRHGLFASETASSEEMTPESRRRAEQALRMAEMLPVVSSPSPRIGPGDPSPGVG